MQDRIQQFLYCSLLLLLVSLRSSAQIDIAKLVQRYNSSTVDTQKVLLLDSMAFYYKDIKPDTGIIFAKRSIDLAQRSNFVLGEAKTRLVLAQLYGHTGDMQQARAEGLHALRLFKGIGNEDGVASTYDQLSVNECKTANFDSATKYLLEAQKIFESKKDTLSLILVYINMGNIMQATAGPDRALVFFQKALDNTKNYPQQRPVILNNIGIVYGQKGEFEKALEYFNAVLLESDTTIPFVRTRLKALMNSAVAYDKMGNYTKAFKYFSDELDLARSYHMPEEEARGLVNLADVEKRVDTGKAIGHLKDALAIAVRIGSKTIQLDIYRGLENVYQEHNDYRNAYSSLDSEMNLAEQLFDVEKAKEVNRLQADYELDKSNLKVDQLLVLNHRKEIWNNTILLFACFITIALLVIVFYYRQTMLLNRQLNTQKEELKQLNAIKDKMFSVIGHDLRSPVGSIVSLLSIWETGGITDDEKKEIINDLKGQTRATLETLDKLLNWGQAQLKGISIFQTEFTPKRIIQDNFELLKEQAVQKDISMTNNCPPDIKIFADRLQFDFVIRNLLSNAIKFTRSQGAIEVDIDNYTIEGYTVFRVKDNGVGISEERQRTLFDPSGVSTLGTALEKGTNIGLKLCKEYVTTNGGKIWVESKEGDGSTFCFSLKKKA